jgi:hypothetical protein
MKYQKPKPVNGQYLYDLKPFLQYYNCEQNKINKNKRIHKDYELFLKYISTSRHDIIGNEYQLQIKKDIIVNIVGSELILLIFCKWLSNDVYSKAQSSVRNHHETVTNKVKNIEINKPKTDIHTIFNNYSDIKLTKNKI